MNVLDAATQSFRAIGQAINDNETYERIHSLFPIKAVRKAARVVTSGVDNLLLTGVAGFFVQDIRLGLYNNSGAAIATPRIVFQPNGGTARILLNASMLGLGASANVIHDCGLMADGDTFRLNNVTAGVVASFSYNLIPTTSYVKRILITSLSIGDNLIYTCPAGKSALLQNIQSGMGYNGVASSMYNYSGGTATVFLKKNTQRLGNTATVANNAGNTIQGDFMLTENDQLFINAAAFYSPILFNGSLYEFNVPAGRQIEAPEGPIE